ncbi:MULTISPECIES: lytic polysaccharide monooxygenase auxiliary activity family 9 protein [Pseudomonas fluorescens group]|uniref:GbpA_2 protein n=1 Tax=Pseudomonas fluorescens TaxID=294 RepID=A0A0D0TKB9_PSEFL|nr:MULTISPECIES: lytic polysaccharide monooxygenase auxiliary activity family 9 protein [Pseudomonas fluorescens group]AZE62689.1 Chitin binding protein [Pseudomonas synxantha]KIR23611.1 GlcNAc-binding protein A precursor [Pseudomonas fluorescens]
MNKPESKPQLKHGRVIFPPARSAIAINEGLIGEWHADEMEGGKNFPSETAGQFPSPYETDVASDVPPADDYILSGGKTDARECVNFTNQEMNQKLGRQFTWPLLDVNAGQTFQVKWEYAEPHMTRGYSWFITKDSWDPEKRISRAQLEPEPFFKDFYTQGPYWDHSDTLKAKTEHEVTLPTGKLGHHVIVLLWIIPNTGNAFYQAFDVRFK